MNKHTVLSGVRATGRLHLGNYLGAVKGMLELQENPDYDTLYMVADVHGITTPYDPRDIKINRIEVIKDYLAAGLDPDKSILFIQSDIPEHLELQFYLSSLVSVARMQHLPTFKEKAKQYPEHITLALLNYPALMAADILIYKADSVPVGLDQEPHLEVAREMARKMNDQFGTDFPEPIRFETKGSVVPSLTGEGKMSKTVNNSYINLNDTQDDIVKKIKSIPTDSGKGEILNKPKELGGKKVIQKMYRSGNSESMGVKALMEFVELFMGESKRIELEKTYVDTGIKYGEIKLQLAESIFEEIKPIAQKRKLLDKDMAYVHTVIDQGTQKAREIAQKTVAEVRHSMGLGSI